MIDFSHLKTKLILEYPFLGSVASGFEMVVDDNLSHFKLKNGYFLYREDYINSLNSSQQLTALANASMQEVLSHSDRRGERSPWLWAMACDYAINSLLLEAGFELPPLVHYDKRFDNLSSEEIYKELASEFLDSEQNDRDYDDELESSDRLSQELRKNRIKDAYTKDDSIKDSFERVFGELFKPKISWRDELRDSIGGFIYSDYSFITPSKKLLYQNIYLPSVVSNHLHIAIAIDSSGSIDELLLASFMSEIEYIFESFRSYDIDLIVCDDRVRFYERFSHSDEIYYPINGGGGTDFRAVFKLIESFDALPSLLLYFSDLDGIFPENEPSYETIWVSPMKKDVAFGRVIELY